MDNSGMATCKALRGKPVSARSATKMKNAISGRTTVYKGENSLVATTGCVEINRTTVIT